MVPSSGNLFALEVRHGRNRAVGQHGVRRHRDVEQGHDLDRQAGGGGEAIAVWVAMLPHCT